MNEPAPGMRRVKIGRRFMGHRITNSQGREGQEREKEREREVGGDDQNINKL